jgi:hypothetical protein
VRHTLLVAVLAAGAVMMPAAFAQQSQNPANQPPPSAPPAAAPMQNPMGGGAMGGQMPGMRPQAGMPEGMMRRRMMMMHHMAALRNPKQSCIDRLARRVGLVAYIGAKLNLTAQQQPLWNKVQDTVNDETHQERKLCDTIKPPAEETALDRLTRMEQMAAARTDGLKAVIPEVRRLYQQLTPEQRAILNHPFRG